MKKKILLTGSRGFVGSAVKSILIKTGIEIETWDREVDGNLLSQSDRHKKFEAGKIDTVIHLAWNDISNKNYDREPINIDFAHATNHFRNEAIERDCDFVTLGSMYENSTAQEGNLYQIAKKSLFQAFNEDNFRKTTWITPTYIFSFNFLRPRIIKALSDRPNEELKTPHAECDWIEVRDVAYCIEHVINSSIKGRVELFSDNRLTVQDFIENYFHSKHKYSDLLQLDDTLEDFKEVKVEKFSDRSRIVSSGITKQFIGMNPPNMRT
jgi:nucleoside-diphosphate-sugar epimerase